MNFAYLARQSLFSLSNPEKRLVACICDVLGGRKLKFVVSFTWCLSPFFTVVTRPHHEPDVGVGGTQQEEDLVCPAAEQIVEGFW